MEKGNQNKFTHEIFNVRLEEHKYFYKIASIWWEDKDWNVPPLERLSTLGVMISEDHKAICAGWLYQTDSSMAVIGFIVADNSVGKTKKTALKILINELENLAKKLGFTTIFMPMEAQSLAKMAKKELNYSGGPTTELIKFI